MDKHDDGDGRLPVGALALEARVVLARGALSAADAERAARSGSIGMGDGEAATLEAGGVILASGRVARRRGRWVFVAAETFAGKDGGR